jgi:hypothetical protein
MQGAGRWRALSLLCTFYCALLISIAQISSKFNHFLQSEPIFGVMLDSTVRAQLPRIVLLTARPFYMAKGRHSAADTEFHN